MKNIKFEILKEVGYILLLTVFFVGIIIGTLSLKIVPDSVFDEYREEICQSVLKENTPANHTYSKMLYSGAITIAIYWIVGMSIVGTPFLIGYVAYKGYSLGYSIATVIRAVGITAGNSYIFQNIFWQNVLLVLIMIYMANFSIKISKNFISSKENIKVDAIKYTMIFAFLTLFYAVGVSILKIFSNFT